MERIGIEIGIGIKAKIGIVPSLVVCLSQQNLLQLLLQNKKKMTLLFFLSKAEC